MSSKLDDKVVLRVLREQRAKQLNALRKEVFEAYAIWVEDPVRKQDSGYLKTGKDSRLLTFNSPEQAQAHVTQHKLRARVDRVDENIEATLKVDGDEKKVIAPGLKLRSKGEGLLYTVHAVGRDSVVLRDPTGQTTHISDKELESGYDLD